MKHTHYVVACMHMLHQLDIQYSSCGIAFWMEAAELV